MVSDCTGRLGPQWLESGRLVIVENERSFAGEGKQVMAENIDIAAWIILFTGLYSLAASIGEWRTPGLWRSMLGDFERQAGLRFISGFFVLSLGAAIYLVNPWRPDDWLSILVTVLGGVMALEGAVILAVGDRFLTFARLLIGRATRFWAAFSAILGLAMIFIAAARL